VTEINHTHGHTPDSGQAPLPGFLARLLAAPKSRPRPARAPAGRAPSAYAAAVLRGELAKLATAKPGTRNDTLNQVAFTLGTHITKGTLSRALAEAALSEVAQRWGGDVGKNLDTIERGLGDGESKGGTR